MFSAIHFIVPRCSSVNEFIFKILDFGDSLTIVIPFSPDTIGDEFSVHFMLIGKSPLTIIQETPVLSPVLKNSSPNVNGDIWGGTKWKGSSNFCLKHVVNDMTQTFWAYVEKLVFKVHCGSKDR